MLPSNAINFSFLFLKENNNKNSIDKTKNPAKTLGWEKVA